MGWDDVVLQKDATFHVDRGEVFGDLSRRQRVRQVHPSYRNLIGLETAHGRGDPSPDWVTRTSTPGGTAAFGVMFQGGALFGSLTVGEEQSGLPLGDWTKLPHEAIGAIVRAKLKLSVGLDGAENKLLSEISGGMKKRAAIARAMALEPDLLFLDEPSAPVSIR